MSVKRKEDNLAQRRDSIFTKLHARKCKIEVDRETDTYDMIRQIFPSQLGVTLAPTCLLVKEEKSNATHSQAYKIYDKDQHWITSDI